MAGPVRTTFQLQGLDGLNAALAAIGQDVATKLGHKAQRKAANGIRDKLKANAPVGTGSTVKTRRTKGGTVVQFDYGRLRDNIRVRKLKNRKAHHIVYAVTVGKAFWGAFQEFGTENMAANPWFRPTFDAAAGEALDVIIATLKKGIEAHAKKAARGRP